MTLDLAALGAKPPGPGADPSAPEVGLAWLVAMARETEAGAGPHPAPAPGLVDRLTSRFEGRPSRDEALGQLHIDPASCLRRARAILDAAPAGEVIAIGDDDGVTLALSLLGAPAPHAVDLDARVLGFLSDQGVDGTCADVLGAPVPEPLRRRFSAAVTDPFRDLDGGLGFLSFAAACVREGGDLFWVDHPDWNYEHEVVRRGMEALGWRVVETWERLHRYPLPEGSFEDVAQAYPTHAAEIRELASRTDAWSHLYRLRRVGT